jgi:hypothetical protein
MNFKDCYDILNARLSQKVEIVEDSSILLNNKIDAVSLPNTETSQLELYNMVLKLQEKRVQVSYVFKHSCIIVLFIIFIPASVIQFQNRLIVNLIFP